MTRFTARTRRGLRADLTAMQALLDERTAERDDLRTRLRNTARMVIDVGAERDEVARKLEALSADHAELARQVADRISERNQALDDLKRRTTAHVTAEQRIELARQALAESGYFTRDEIGDDIAPRIIELREHTSRYVKGLQEDLDDAAETIQQLRERLAALRSHRQITEGLGDAPARKPPMTALPPTAAESRAIAAAQPATDSATPAPAGRKARGVSPRTPKGAAGRTEPSGGTEETGIAE